MLITSSHQVVFSTSSKMSASLREMSVKLQMTYFWVSGNNQKPTQTTRGHLILAALHFVHASFRVPHLQEKTSISC